MTVSILSEVPDLLHNSMKLYLEQHPDWDQDRLFTAALSLFLMQNSSPEVNVTSTVQIYLETLFKDAA